MRTAICEFLERDSDLWVAGRFVSAEQFLANLGEVRAGVVIIDQTLPGICGIELVRRLSQLRPDLACLLYTVHIDEHRRKAARAAGARGCVAKGTPSELLSSLERVIKGETVYDEAVA